MTPDLITALIEYGLPILVGVYFILVGYQIIGPKPGTNPTHDYRFAKYGHYSRLAGFALLAAPLLRFTFSILPK